MSAPASPFVGLDYFHEDEAELFFGRDEARRRIVGNLRAARLTLLYAQSGVGKSSLLRAGVAARLRRPARRDADGRGGPRYVPVVFSAWQGDATAGLIGAVAAEAGADARAPARGGTLEQAIDEAAEALDATLLVVLDQFEEHFLYDDGEAGDGFDDELARCVNRRDLRAHFLIAVREDAYSLIGQRFKARIPNVYGNYLHLDFLDARAAREAVLKPVEAVNARRGGGEPRFEIEDALVAAVLEQVRRGRVTLGDDGPAAAPDGGSARIETAYLQLVMRRLWDEERAAGSPRLRLETLERLGGAQTIVRAHLDDVMDRLDADQRDAAAAALRFLVTSDGRKIALSSRELREFSDTDAATLEPALVQLERSRILRAVPGERGGGAARREIYHDVLAPAILDWRRRHVEARREAALARARARARRLEARNRRLGAAVVALSAIALALALYLWNPPVVERLELAAVDARFELRGGAGADPRVVLVEVDRRTLDRFAAPGEGQLSRPVYARLIERLGRGDPAVVAVDVVFAGRRDPRDDRRLLAAVRRTRDRLVLAWRYFTVAAPASAGAAPELLPDLLGRPRTVSGTGVRSGYDGVPLDSDDHVRRAEYLVDTTVGTRGETFAFAAADVARRGALSRDLDDLPTAPRRADGEQTRRTTWIDYAGAPGSTRSVSALDVLDGRVAARRFAGDVVVVGLTAGGGDRHRTPLDGGRSRPGPELHANAIGSLLRGSPLRDAPRAADILAILALASAGALAGLLGSWWRGLGLVVCCGAAYAVLAQVAFGAGRIVAVVVPLLALAVAGAASAAVALGRMGRARGRERAAAAAAGPPADL